MIQENLYLIVVSGVFGVGFGGESVVGVKPFAKVYELASLGAKGEGWIKRF